MTTTPLRTACAALTVGAFALVTTACGSDDDKAVPVASSSPTPRTIVFDQRDDMQQFIDTAPLGGEDQPPSAGDAFANSNVLLDPSTGSEVGRTHGFCDVTVPGADTVAICFFSFVLNDGTLSGQGPFPFNDNPVTLALTGGTGAYAGARGTMTYASGEGEKSTWTLTLLP